MMTRSLYRSPEIQHRAKRTGILIIQLKSNIPELLATENRSTHAGAIYSKSEILSFTMAPLDFVRFTLAGQSGIRIGSRPHSLSIRA